jgi:hypothetical protein
MIDSITLPRTLGYSICALATLAMSFNQVPQSISTHPVLFGFLLLLSMPFLFGKPYLDKFYGESQRINGTLQLVLISASVVIGLTCVKRNLYKVLRTSIILNGAVVSILILISHYAPVQIAMLLTWTRGNEQGGINENFKSMFIALCLTLHLTMHKSLGKVRIKKNFYAISTTIHIIALFFIGSLQGILLVITTTIILASTSRAKWRLGIPLVFLISNFIYLVFISWNWLWSFVDSSTLERINLAKKAIKMLQNAPVVTPNPLRISEHDFSDATLTEIAGTDVWVDDVHNVYLNMGNTNGIFFLVGIIFFLLLFLYDFTKNAPLLRWETRCLGAVILAVSIILSITILHPIYLFLYSIIIGVYCAKRYDDLKMNELSGKSISKGKYLSLSSFRKSIGIIITTGLTLQLTFGVWAIVREYSIQREINGLMFANLNISEHSERDSFTEIELVLQKSRDLRLIYEVGRHYHLRRECIKTLKVTNILRKQSSGHFLSKKLESLHEECLSR